MSKTGKGPSHRIFINLRSCTAHHWPVPLLREVRALQPADAKTLPGLKQTAPEGGKTPRAPRFEPQA